MREEIDLGWIDAELVLEREDSVDDRILGRVGRWGLQAIDMAGRLVEQNEIGECAADVGAEAVGRAAFRLGHLNFRSAYWTVPLPVTLTIRPDHRCVRRPSNR
jgi:hypothetical protein